MLKRYVTELTFSLQGISFTKAFGELKKLSHLKPDEYLEWQKRKRWEIFEHHLANNTSYKEYIGGKNIGKWEDIPILRKHSLPLPLTQKLSSGYSTHNVIVNHTSGSTGTPFYFAKDRFCHSVTWALIAKYYKEHSVDIFIDKQARFYGVPVNIVPRIKEKIKDLLLHRERFDVLDTSDERQRFYFHRLKRGKFTYINGYARSLIVFAKYLIRNGIVLKDECQSLKICIVTAAILFENDRTLMAKAFGIQIINEYGASEIGIIAFENTKGEFAINREEIYIEVVDNENCVLPFGMEGRLIITSLFNKAMPFIRYDIGDIASIDKSKGTNKLIIKSLVGRSNDSLLLKNGQEVSVAIIDHALKPLLNNNYDLVEFLFRQWDYDKFTFEYVAGKDLDKERTEACKVVLEKDLKHSIKLEFLRRDKLERTSSWKLKYFERMV